MYDTIYLLVIPKNHNKKITTGKVATQVSHAVGLLASKYPNQWEEHIKNGQRAVALKCYQLDKYFDVKLNNVGYNEKENYAYASVFDRTDKKVFVLAILPKKRLKLTQLKIL